MGAFKTDYPVTMDKTLKDYIDRTSEKVPMLKTPWFAERYAPAPFATPAAEADPTGRDANAPGAKLDAGKAEYDMVLFSFPAALAQVDRIGKFGARKYTKGGFLDVPNGQARYFNAEMRHGVKHLSGELFDPESNELHLAHKAWNALAELELYLRGKGAA